MLIFDLYRMILCLNRKIIQNDNLIILKNFFYDDVHKYEFMDYYRIIKSTGQIIYANSKTESLW